MKEDDLYEQLAPYMNIQYPGVIYHFDLSGVWTPSHKARNLYGRLNDRDWPDFTLAHVVHEANVEEEIRPGLYIEIKREGTTIRLKNGRLTADKHIRSQVQKLLDLRKQGYCAEMAVGWNEIKYYVDMYMNRNAPYIPGSLDFEPDKTSLERFGEPVDISEAQNILNGRTAKDTGSIF